MARLVVTELVSLDGVMEAPGGEPGYAHSGWVMRFPDPAPFEYKYQEVLDHDALLLGRVTYESFAEGWTTRTGPFAERMNSMPKFVVSNTISVAGWQNSTVLDGDVVERVTQLKRERPGDLLLNGSRTLLQAMREHDMVDEYRLMVFPIVLGSGFRLFGDTVDAQAMELVDTKVFGGGTMLLTYRRGARIKPGSVPG